MSSGTAKTCPIAAFIFVITALHNPKRGEAIRLTNATEAPNQTISAHTSQNSPGAVDEKFLGTYKESFLYVAVVFDPFF